MALDNGVDLEKILILSGARSEYYKMIMGIAKEREIPIKKVPREKLDWLTQKDHEGIVAFRSVIKYYNIEDILSQVYEKGEMPFFVLLDGVTDVRNIGAIARSALCFGAQTLVLPHKDRAEVNERTVISSAGALKELPVCRVPEISKAITYLKSNGLTILAATMDGEESIGEVKLDIPLALILGDEGKGISEKTLGLCDAQVSIPMNGHFDSLNVSVAAGICLYEISSKREG